MEFETADFQIMGEASAWTELNCQGEAQDASEDSGCSESGIKERDDGGEWDGERQASVHKAPSPVKGHEQVTKLEYPHPDLDKACTTRRTSIRRDGT